MCVFRADRKNKMAILSSDWIRHFDFSSENTAQNSMKLDGKQDLNVLYQVCVFRADRKTKWSPRSLIDGYILTFPLKPLNGSQQNLTGSKISTSSTKFVRFFWLNMTGLCFWLSETFFTSPLKPLNKTQRNFTGSKISMYYARFVFSGPIGMAVMVYDYLRNLTWNGSSYCTHVSDSGPLGLLCF